jgi:predicted RNA-binding protein with PIN domain
MILLVDGYNVVKQAMLKSEITDQERNTFIKQLGKYCKIKGHKARLVFDGGPSDATKKENLHGVTVVYSGYSESADDYIKDYLDDHKALDILLVSSDRDICRHASRLNIEQIDAIDFYGIMRVALESCSSCARAQDHAKASSGILAGATGRAVKTSETSNSELDMLMQEGSKIVPKKLEDLDFKTNIPGIKRHKLTKKETKKFKKIKKL